MEPAFLVRCLVKSYREHERTPQGFLTRTYSNIQQRVNGQQAAKAHIYKGLPLLSRAAFYNWARDNADFWQLYRRWVWSDYARRLTPSVARIEAHKGYALGNMVWLTAGTSSALGNKNRNVQYQHFLEVFQHARERV